MNWDDSKFSRLDGKPFPAPAEGVKHDQEKARMDLVPKEAMDALGTVLGYGSRKYGDRNWEKGMDWGRVYAALQRHLLAFWSGEDLDPESGLPHLSHVLANGAFLAAYQKRGIGKDTRPKPTHGTITK